MKNAYLIPRYLLALIFLVFGLNGFLHFIPTGPMPAGAAGQFMNALVESHYTIPVFSIQLFSAILLAANRFVPLALTLLAPVIVNIVLFHALMLPSGLPFAAVVVVLWLIVAFSVRSAFAGLFAARV